jgi:hypothetical protein
MHNTDRKWITHKSIQRKQHDAVGSRVVPSKGSTTTLQGPTAAPYLQGIHHIARGFAHFPTLCVPHQAVQVNCVKGYLVCDSEREMYSAQG